MNDHFRKNEASEPPATNISFHNNFDRHISWNGYYQLGYINETASRKRCLSEIDLTNELKKLKLSLPTEIPQASGGVEVLCPMDIEDMSADMDNVYVQDMYTMDDSYVPELLEPQIYVDEGYLEIARRIPIILLRPTPSEELKYINSRQLVLYRPFIWKVLFDRLFNSLNLNSFGSMDCDEVPNEISHQYFNDELMDDGEEYYYGDAMETD